MIVLSHVVFGRPRYSFKDNFGASSNSLIKRPTLFNFCLLIVFVHASTFIIARNVVVFDNFWIMSTNGKSYLCSVESISFFLQTFVVIREFTLCRKMLLIYAQKHLIFRSILQHLQLRIFLSFLMTSMVRSFSSFDDFLFIQQASMIFKFLTIRHLVFGFWQVIMEKPVTLEPEQLIVFVCK